MSRKPDSNAIARSPQGRARHAASPTPAFRRRMVLALIALSAGAIAWAVYGSRTSATPAPVVQSQAMPAQEPRPASARPLASFAPFHDFGTVSMAAGNVTHRYVITNLGPAPLNITQLSTSCMCTVATLITASTQKGPFGMPGHGPIPVIRESIAPRERAQVEVTFDPAAHGPAGIGLIERTVTVRNDAGEPLQLAFRATVRP